MNKAIFGILAAAAIATVKNASRGSSSKISSIEDFFVQMAEENVRPDVFLAVAYSFIDFGGLEYNKALSKITNLVEPFSLEEQPIISYRLKSDPSAIKSFALSIEQAIVNSFNGDKEKATGLVLLYGKEFKDAYNLFFKENDYGLGYLYLQNGVFPEILSADDWINFFKGSSPAQSFVDFSKAKNLEELDALRDVYFSAIIRSDLEYKTMEDGESEMVLGANYGVGEIFRLVDSVFETLATSDKTKNLKIERYLPVELRNLLDSDPSLVSGTKSRADYQNLMMFSLIIDGLDWVKEKLISIGTDGINENTTYLELHKFWNIPERGPSHTMVSIQMDLYRGNNLTSIIPEQYKRPKGEIENSWQTYGSDSWSVSSWVVYYIYKILRDNPVPEFNKWEFGLEFSQRVFDLFKGDKISKIRTAGAFLKFMEGVYKSYVSEGTQFILNEILSGSPDSVSDVQLSYIGWNNNNDYDIKSLGKRIYPERKSRESIIEIYKASSNADALNFMGAFLGHCRTSDQTSSIYSVFYMGVPYYTIEVNSSGEMMQFKGLQNRSLGLMPNVDPKDIAGNSRKKGDARAKGLFVDDLRNFKTIYAQIKSVVPNLRLSEQVISRDLVLVDEAEFAKVAPQYGLSHTMAQLIGI